jgi:predicted nucleic acid-binding protein
VIFVDTSFWVALRNRRDSHLAAAGFTELRV